MVASFPGCLPFHILLTTYVTFEPPGEVGEGHVCGQENGAGDSLGTRLVIIMVQGLILGYGALRAI